MRWWTWPALTERARIVRILRREMDKHGRLAMDEIPGSMGYSHHAAIASTYAEAIEKIQS